MYEPSSAWSYVTFPAISANSDYVGWAMSLFFINRLMEVTMLVMQYLNILLIFLLEFYWFSNAVKSYFIYIFLSAPDNTKLSWSLTLPTGVGSL